MSKRAETLVETQFIEEAKRRHRQAIVHPLVLLSILDHWQRGAKGAARRVVGLLLGEREGNDTHITNSFALCFDESPKDPKIWYIDETYLQKMFRMHKKVSARETIVGWYATTSQASIEDLGIHELFCKYAICPIYLTVAIPPHSARTNIQAYIQTQVPASDVECQKTFVLIKCKTGFLEAEQVAVDYLLRDCRVEQHTSVENHVQHVMNSLRQLIDKLEIFRQYIDKTIQARQPPNLQILYNIQTIYNLLLETTGPDLKKALFRRANDQHLITYVGTIVKTLIATHTLINTQIERKQLAMATV